MGEMQNFNIAGKLILKLPMIRHAEALLEICHKAQLMHSVNSLCTQAAITRCSQPLAGFSARCVEDEQMLQAVLKANPSSNYMYVVDTRPKVRRQTQNVDFWECGRV